MTSKITGLEAAATIGIDIGKNMFHLIGLDQKGAIVLRQKLTRKQVDSRLANMPPCLIGMEACVGAHHLGRHLKAFGHDTRLMPARYVRPYLKGPKNDFRDAEAIAEAVLRPTMKPRLSLIRIGNAFSRCGIVRRRGSIGLGLTGGGPHVAMAPCPPISKTHFSIASAGPIA